jgi:hypothetical protein
MCCARPSLLIQQLSLLTFVTVPMNQAQTLSLVGPSIFSSLIQFK